MLFLVGMVYQALLYKFPFYYRFKNGLAAREKSGAGRPYEVKSSHISPLPGEYEDNFRVSYQVFF